LLDLNQVGQVVAGEPARDCLEAEQLPIEPLRALFVVGRLTQAGA
jgi:hypothetical protein